MTTAAPAAPARPYVPRVPRRPGFGHLLAAEWTKIRSVRSTVWTLLLFVVITVGLTALLTWLIVANWNGPHAAARDATISGDPVSFVLGAGLGLGKLTLCVLGVLVISSEYSTGVIRASLLAVPKRLSMLAAKGIVLSILLLIASEIVCFASFFVGAALLHSQVQVSLGDNDVLRSVLGSGLSLTVLGLFSMGVGLLIRHTAGAITTAIGVFFVLPILSGLLPDSWGAHINAYLPENAGAAIAVAHPTGALLSAWEGLGVFCIWTALLVGMGAWLLVKRDA